MNIIIYWNYLQLIHKQHHIHVSNILILKLLISKEICLNNKIFYQHIQTSGIICYKQCKAQSKFSQHTKILHSHSTYSIYVLQSTISHTLTLSEIRKKAKQILWWSLIFSLFHYSWQFCAFLLQKKSILPLIILICSK